MGTAIPIDAPHTNKIEKYNIAFYGEFLRGARHVHGHDGYTDLRIV